MCYAETATAEWGMAGHSPGREILFLASAEGL